MLFEGHSSEAMNAKFPDSSSASETVGVLHRSSQVSKVTDPSRAVYVCSAFNCIVGSTRIICVPIIPLGNVDLSLQVSVPINLGLSSKYDEAYSPFMK